MTIITDKVQVKDGADYSFVSGKIPFAITCSSTLQHGGYNLIDLDLVIKMKIPLQRIKVCRMSYMGENLRSVGFIDQTIHCVQNGVVKGTVHLSAKVVRNLSDSFNVDCVASAKTFERLTGHKPPDPPDTEDEQQLEDDAQEEKLDQTNPKEKYDQNSSSVSSCSTICSDGCHDPVSHNWLFQCSLLAQAAQKDSFDSLLETENYLANVIKINEDENESTDDDNNTDPDQDQAYTETEDEEHNSDEEFHCELCFRYGKPVNIVTNHDTFCPTCPTMTPRQKEVEIGMDWKAKAEVIIRKRFQREKLRRRDSADQ